jgi:hypothetical protein
MFSAARRAEVANLLTPILNIVHFNIVAEEANVRNLYHMTTEQYI